MCKISFYNQYKAKERRFLTKKLKSIERQFVFGGI